MKTWQACVTGVVLGLGLIAGLLVLVKTTRPPTVCIQEVYQSNGVSREYGRLYRVQPNGVWVCSRDTR